ncbi:MAG: hypothetical protein WCQ95_11250 [Bacteroidota bacterium]
MAGNAEIVLYLLQKSADNNAKTTQIFERMTLLVQNRYAAGRAALVLARVMGTNFLFTDYLVGLDNIIGYFATFVI